MPGGKTPLFIPLGAGIQTDIDDRLLPVGHALDVTNQYVKTNGNLAKRAGMVLQPGLIQPGPVALPTTWQLAKYKGARLSLGSQPTNPLATYSPAQAAWDSTSTDRRAPMAVALTKLATKGGVNPRIAAGSGYYYLVYQDLTQANVIHFDVLDQTTFALVSAQSFATAGSYLAFGVEFCNGFAVAITEEFGVGIVFRVMTPATLAVASTTYAVAPVGNLGFDTMVKNATTISVVYQIAGNLADAVDFVPSTAATTGWSPRDATAATINIFNGAAWFDDLGASGKQALVTCGSIQGVRVQWDIPSAGATRQAVSTHNADPTATANVIQAEGHTTGNSATGEYQVLFTIAASPNTNNLTKMAVRTGGALTPGFALFRSISLFSRAFAYNGDFYALFCFSLDTDANSYAMRIPVVTAQPATSGPQAIFGVGSTGNVNQFGTMNTQLARVLSISGLSFATTANFLERISKTAASGYGPTLGVLLVQINFLDPSIPESTGIPIEAFDALVIPGGALGHFDGRSYGELGFAYQALQSTSLTPAAGGALTASSTYWYVFVWGRMDGRGRVWRSGPSVPQPVALAAGQTQVTVAVPTLRVTGYSNVFVEIYRGAALDDNEFQLVAQIPNDLTVDAVSYVDTTSDVALAIGEPLYTNGDPGALPNTTIPGSPFVFTFQNRLCFISADDPTQLWFSNQITPTNGVRFNTQNVITIADERGGMYGAGTMDDKVVAFKQSAVYAFSGDGPDDTGAGSFSTPQIVALGLGCTQPRSIVSQKDGVMFESQGVRSGIQMINGGLSVALDKNGMPFGAAVQRYQTETIASAILIPEQSQVRWYCRSGRVLVFDLVSSVWTTFLLNIPGARVLSALAIDGGALVATDDNDILFEDTTGTVFTDNGLSQTVISATPWIQGTGPRGFERVREFIGMGKTIGDHTLLAQLYTDFDESTVVASRTFVLTAAGTQKWNWEWIPRVQRCSSFKVVFSETSAAAGFESEGVTALVGSKRGLARQSPLTRGQ